MKPGPAKIIPGFRLSLGLTIAYLSLIVLFPLMTLVVKALELDGGQWLGIVTDRRVLASFRLSFGGAAIAALVNGGFGLLVAWVLVRYPFPGHKLINALIDLPFALPTAVAGIALTALYAPHGWIGALLPFKLAFTPLGVVVAMIFIGLPFVVRSVEPILHELDRELEEAALSLGATAGQSFRLVIFPALAPALGTGISLAFARAVGEYGSVIFIAGNLPGLSEITPLLIITRLEQYDYAGATALACLMLAASFTLLVMVNGLQKWRHDRRGAAR